MRTRPKSIFMVSYLATLLAGGETLLVDGNAAGGSSFQTIQEALDKANPGDTVRVGAGIYREALRLPSGTAGKPVTLEATGKDEVIVSGMRNLKGWRKQGDGIYVTRTDIRPTRLYSGFRREPLAREPNEGWWRAEQAGEEKLSDPENLRGFGNKLEEAEIYVWAKHGSRYHTLPIRKLDSRKGCLELGPSDKGRPLRDEDYYYLQNHPSLIDQPGEWAAVEERNGWKVYYRPERPKDLERTEIPFHENVLSVQDVKHIVIRGLHIIGGTRNGIDVNDSSDVEIIRCAVYHNNRHGIGIRSANRVHVTRCLSTRNYCGIGASYSKNITVEENEIAFNGMDGLLFTWKSDHLTARRNYIHDHMLWGHPDNTQFYRGVTDVTFIDNLLITAGQSVMMQETADGIYRGNMMIGSGANMLIFGHKNAVNYRVHNNTLAFAGYRCLALTGKDYDVRENIFMTGHDGTITGTRDVTGYTGSRNLFWNADGLKNPAVLESDGGWHRSLKAFQNATGQDLDSVYADPRFRNAPAAYRVMDSKQLHRSDRETLYLRGGTEGFAKGDHIELNFDGIDHRIKAVTDEAITITPPLPEKPIKSWLVANWRANTDFRLDLRLRKDSAGAKLTEDGGPAGSSIDIQAFRLGDFDGDGRRDLPVMRSTPSPFRSEILKVKSAE